MFVLFYVKGTYSNVPRKERVRQVKYTCKNPGLFLWIREQEAPFFYRRSLFGGWE